MLPGMVKLPYRAQPQPQPVKTPKPPAGPRDRRRKPPSPWLAAMWKEHAEAEAADKAVAPERPFADGFGPVKKPLQRGGNFDWRPPEPRSRLGGKRAG